MSADASKYHLEIEERVTAVMAYTQDLLVWGDVITKQAIRVSTWLRTPAIPKYILFHNAQAMDFGTPNPKPQFFPELHLPSSLVIAFHIKPPDHDPVDHDPTEGARRMAPVTALVGHFRFDGFIRMSTQTSLDRFLDVSKEAFSAMYDIEITQPSFPALGVIRAPYTLLRGDSVMYSPRGDQA